MTESAHSPEPPDGLKVTENGLLPGQLELNRLLGPLKSMNWV